MSTLRKNLIRLAYEKAELREHLLPLIQGDREAASRVVDPNTIAESFITDYETMFYQVQEVRSTLQRDGKKLRSQASDGALDPRLLKSVAEHIHKVATDIQLTAEAWITYANMM